MELNEIEIQRVLVLGRSAIDCFGINHQLLKCVEELSELSVEICKVCQMFFDESYEENHEETAEDRNKFANKFTITTSLALDEVVDVWITLFQAIMILDDGAFVNRLNIKLDRLEELIKDKKEKKGGKKM